MPKSSAPSPRRRARCGRVTAGLRRTSRVQRGCSRCWPSKVAAQSRAHLSSIRRLSHPLASAAHHVQRGCSTASSLLLVSAQEAAAQFVAASFLPLASAQEAAAQFVVTDHRFPTHERADGYRSAPHRTMPCALGERHPHSHTMCAGVVPRDMSYRAAQSFTGLRAGAPSRIADSCCAPVEASTAPTLHCSRSEAAGERRPPIPRPPRCYGSAWGSDEWQRCLRLY